MVKSACGIEAVYMCFNGTGIWGGETIYTDNCVIIHRLFHTRDRCRLAVREGV